MSMKNSLLAIGVVLCGLTLSQESVACTSIIVSEKATPDGRPLLWKHRDTGARYNHIVYEQGDRFSYIGLTNSDKLDGDIWIGTNDAGFSIMNTASYNLKDDTIPDEQMGLEGRLMRQALAVCRSTADFEHYLDTLSRPMRVEANFGVIDAMGGAAYYETNNSRYHKKDVNDPSLAPNGYLIYTNFSFEGEKDKGMGYIRYESAQTLFKEMYPIGITPLRIFEDVSASYYHSLMGLDLKRAEQTEWRVEQDFIPRAESTASVVVQGVKPGMDPELTTMWTELGYPPTSIPLPLWVKMGDRQPALVTYDERRKTAPLCYYATTLREQAYPIHRGNGQKYIHWTTLWNADGTGYLQRISPVREEVYQRFAQSIAEWEATGLDTERIAELYEEVAPLIEKTYQPLINNER